MTAGKRMAEISPDVDPEDKGILVWQDGASGRCLYLLAMHHPIWHSPTKGGSGALIASAPKTATGVFG